MPNLAKGPDVGGRGGGAMTPLAEAVWTSGEVIGEVTADPIRVAMLEFVGLTVSSLDPTSCSKRLANGIGARSPANFRMTSLALSDGRYVSTKLIRGLTSSGDLMVCEVRGDQADNGLCLLIIAVASVCNRVMCILIPSVGIAGFLMLGKAECL